MFYRSDGLKRLLVANKQTSSKSRYSDDRFNTILNAQIENVLEVGWEREDIILLSNFDFEFMSIKATKMKFNEFCLTGSKMWAIKWLFDNNKVDEIIYSADLDAWQNCWFDEPEFSGDIGACQYSGPKWNGGSIFWKPTSKDIVYETIKRLLSSKSPKEEPILNQIFRSEEYKDRISLLNSTWNVGCSGFIPRFERSIKPIRVCHFHPNNGIAWEIHGLDRDGTGCIAVTVRLERLLRKYYPHLATELKDKSIPLKKQEMERKKHPERYKNDKYI